MHSTQEIVVGLGKPTEGAMQKMFIPFIKYSRNVMNFESVVEK
jgi:hypothetical protein